MVRDFMLNINTHLTWGSQEIEEVATASKRLAAPRKSVLGRVLSEYACFRCRVRRIPEPFHVVEVEVGDHDYPRGGA